LEKQRLLFDDMMVGRFDVTLLRIRHGFIGYIGNANQIICRKSQEKGVMLYFICNVGRVDQGNPSAKRLLWEAPPHSLDKRFRDGLPSGAV
jgi:hypothetical protein